MSALNAQEKVKVRHHTGYLNVQEAQTFVLGTPAGVETQFIIEGAMNRILEEAVPEVRRHLQILDSIEEQMVMNLELLQVTKVDTIDINSTGADREQRQLIQVYDRWVDSLCNLLGCMRNPFDKRKGKMGTGGINARVAG
jgi:hypothetical protein